MKKAILSIVLATILLVACGKKEENPQTQPAPTAEAPKAVVEPILNVDSLVKEIKKQYAEVNKNWNKATISVYNYDLSKEEKGYSFGLFNNNLIKIIAFENEGGMINSTEFYYQNKKLFFVFNSSKIEGDYEGAENYSADGYRCYFHNNKLVKLLDSKKKEVAKGSQEFQKVETQVLAEEKVAMDNFKKSK